MEVEAVETEVVIPQPKFARINLEELESLIRSRSIDVYNVIIRQSEEPDSAKYQFKPDPAVQLIGKVVQAFQEGTGASELAEPIDRLIRNQTHRSKLINQLLVSHQYGRLARFLKAREPLETFLVECSQRGDLTPSEAFGLLKYVQTELDDIVSTVSADATDVRDVMDLVRKTDHAIQLKQADIGRRFASTSSQSREIIRHLAYGLIKTISSVTTPAVTIPAS